jgi:hypothetical protein
VLPLRPVRANRLRRSLSWRLGALAVLSIVFASAPARADVTSWLAVGTGAAVESAQGSSSPDIAPAISYSIGVGSTPLAPFVVGGLVRGTTMFNLGTDLGLAARVSTGGFARGDWGFAVDAGAMWRSWRDGHYGTWPLLANLTAGTPWGLQLAVGAQFFDVSGATPATGAFAVLEIDLLRFTVMRQGSSERWWQNPNPAGGRPTSAPPAGEGVSRLP